jgi:hypothetical protein
MRHVSFALSLAVAQILTTQVPTGAATSQGTIVSIGATGGVIPDGRLYAALRAECTGKKGTHVLT